MVTLEHCRNIPLKIPGGRRTGRPTPLCQAAGEEEGYGTMKEEEGEGDRQTRHWPPSAPGKVRGTPLAAG